VLFVGGCPVMIGLCLTADMYSTRRCLGGPRRDPQTRREMEEMTYCGSQSHFLKRQISSQLSRRTAIDLKSPAPIDGFLTQIEVRVPGSGYGCGSRGSSDHVHAPPKSNSTTAGFANAPGQAFPSPVFWVAFSYLPFPRPSPSRVPHIFAAHTYHKRLCKNDA
jgi:hypothetical protein